MSLEIPLPQLFGVWLWQCDRTCLSWIEIAHELFDGRAFPCRIHSLKYHKKALLILNDPLLEFHQFILKSETLFLIELLFNVTILLKNFSMFFSILRQIGGKICFLPIHISPPLSSPFP